MNSISAYLFAIALIIGYSGISYSHTNEYGKESKFNVQGAIISILRMLASADFIPGDIREVLVIALSKESITKDFEAWKRVLLEKLDQLDGDKDGYKKNIIVIIDQSLHYTSMLYPLESILSRVKVPGTEFTGVDLFQAFNLIGGFVKLIKDKQNPSYSLTPIKTTSMLRPGDCIAVQTWTGWWTFMIVTDSDPSSGDVQVVCYASPNSNDCIQSETEFFLGFQKSLSIKEVTLTANISGAVHLVEYSSMLTLPTSTTIEMARSKINDTVQGWSALFSNTSEHLASWAKTGQAKSYQVDEIRWQLRKQVFNAKLRRVFIVWFGKGVFLTGAEAVKNNIMARAVIKQTAGKAGEHFEKETLKQGVKYAGQESLKQGAKTIGKETFKRGAKHAGKETFKQGAKHAGKETFKQGAKHAGKETFKQGAKHAGKETFKQGAKHAGKETFKQGAKHAGKETFKQGAKHAGKETFKQGAKHAGKETFKQGAKHAGKETFKQGAKHAGKETFKQGAKHAGKETLKQGAKHAGKETFKQGAKHAGKETLKQGAKQAGKETLKQGAKQAGKETLKQGAKQAGKETLKQGAKQAGKETLKQGAKQAGKETLKQGAKQAGKETLKQGAKQAGKETLKQGAKQAGKETLKQGAKQAGKETLKQGAKQAGKETLKQGAKHAGKETLKQGAKQAGKETLKQGAKQAGKETLKQGAKQAGKETFKQGAKQAGKHTFKQGAKHAGKETFKQGAKQAGKHTFKQGAKHAGKETFKQGAKQGAKQAGKQGVKQGAKQTAKEGVKQTGRAALCAALVAELSFLGYDLYSEYQLYLSGEISRDELCKRVTGVLAGSVGSVSGAAGGATVGAGLGSIIPGLGTAIGGAIGTIIGGVSGHFGAKVIGSEIGEKLKHFCATDDSEEPLEDVVCDENCDEIMIVEDSEEDAFFHHDCDDEGNEDIKNPVEDSETFTGDTEELGSEDALVFYFQSNDSESGEEIPMKGILFPVFSQIRIVCWEEMEKDKFCYCTLMTE